MNDYFHQFLNQNFHTRQAHRESYCFLIGYTCEVSNANYKVIDGSCFYFETATTLNYEDAQTNCATKFGNLQGGLFEPRTSQINQLVFAEATNFVTAATNDFWLGINDLATQGLHDHTFGSK